MDKLLEEQLKRIRQLNEWVAQLQRGVRETNRAVVRNRQPRVRGPLQDVRDYRTLQSHEYSGTDWLTRPDKHQDTAPESSQRKRRRR
jgi:hypothetical protein